MKPVLLRILFTGFLLILHAGATAQTIFPRAAAAPATVISHINVNGRSFPEIFTVVSLQGNVNRTVPRIFVVGNGIVEAVNGTSTQFWLDKFTGYTKNGYTDVLALVKDFAADLNGCVLYDPAVFSHPGTGYYPPGFQVSDDNLARINVTAMLSAKHHAVILTEAQRNELITNYGVTLPVLADSRTLPSDWLGIYTWAMTNLAPDMRTDITHHLSHFCLGALDYVISRKIFTYNNYRGPKNAAVNAMEDSFLNISPPNSPVIGVWYLQSDEGSFVQKLTEKGKFITVTYETFNLSWTTGFPPVSIPAQPRRSLTLDPAKVYLSVTRTDGDNLSFLDRVFPGNFESPVRTDYPMGWEMLNTINELNPQLVSYYYGTIGNSNFVTPVSGVGYTAPILPMAYRKTFLDKTNQYMAGTDCRLVRTLWQDFKQALPYSYLSNARGILVGYNVGDVSVANNAQANRVACGKAFMKTYDISELPAISSYSGSTPAFFNVSVSSMSINDIVPQLDALPPHFEVVTPEELVDLYLQYADGQGIQYKDFTGITIEPTANAAGEQLHLYDYGFSSFDFAHNARFADMDNYFVYKLSVAPGATNVSAALTMYNNYLVQAGSDPFNWTEVARAASDVHDGSNLGTRTVDLTPFLTGSREIYVRIGDASPADGWGGALVRLEMTTSAPTLPVTFLPLTVTKSAETAVLRWSTVASQTDDYFEVLRSKDGAVFQPLAKVYAGEPAGTARYEATDTRPLPGINYYRIRGVDKAGVESFTRTVAVEFNATRHWQVFPNPAESEVNVTYESRELRPGSISVYDSRGNKVLDKPVMDIRGLNHQTLDISALPAGVYIIRHETDSGVAVKFVKTLDNPN